MTINIKFAIFCAVLATQQLLSAVETDKKVKRNRQCRSGWHYNNTSCYLFSHGKLQWGEALAYCLSNGARLVEIDSPGEDNYISDFLRNRRPGYNYWIGMSDLGSEGNWIWARSRQGVSFAYNNWAGGEPQGALNDNCGIVWADNSYLWDDTTCSSYLPFICEEPLGG